ncbi:MAG: SH3 domain-containing protein [Anaerolineae bacterium]|nr:SH3 domain-containing protein [Anaerolineae bacterium]
MRRLHKLLFLFIALLFSIPTAAQEVTPDVFQAATYLNRINLRAGPGETHDIIAQLGRGDSVTILERSASGVWLHVQHAYSGLDGWVVGGYLTLNPALRFSDLPVNTEVADAQTVNLFDPALQTLYSYPVLPTLSPAMTDLFAQGQANGLRADVATKVGDSLVANEYYLTLLGAGTPQLGAHDDLAETVAFFGEALSQPSTAARVGLASYTVMDPMWADKNICQPNETALACEYRLRQPAVALIMFGANDVQFIDAEQYGKWLKAIIEESLAVGVIPVLFTFSYDPESPLWANALAFNLKLGELATEYEIPLVNLWAAARILPQYGLDEDKIHLKNSGFDVLDLTNGNEAFFGVTLQNLLALRVLDTIRRTIIEPTLELNEGT